MHGMLVLTPPHILQHKASGTTCKVLLCAKQAQVEKVLASWKKEKIFSDDIVDQCAISAGLELPSTAAPVSAADADDAVAKAGVPSPVLSIFSEPSAGSVDLDALDSFPPKTVASANTEAVR